MPIYIVFDVPILNKKDLEIRYNGYSDEFDKIMIDASDILWFQEYHKYRNILYPCSCLAKALTI